jgi:hypothetical protein
MSDWFEFMLEFVSGTQITKKNMSTNRSLLWFLYKMLNRKPLLRADQRQQLSLTERITKAQESLIDFEKKLRANSWFKARIIVSLFAAMYLPVELKHVRENGTQDNIFTLTTSYINNKMNRSSERAKEIKNVLQV